MHNPFLVGDSIYLRTIEERDLTPQYQQWFNNEEICRFNSHHRFPNYRENMEDYFKNVISSRNHLILAIIDKVIDRHIGNISLQNINTVDRSAEFAIVIGDKEFWGRGVGREAGKLIVGHGFTALNLHRIECGTSDENIGMQKLADALGFKKEGVARKALFKNGAYHDTLFYGLLREEYQIFIN